MSSEPPRLFDRTEGDASLRTMEDQIAELGIHHPPARVTLVLDLIVGPQVPFAVSLAAPKRIFISRVRRPNPPWIVRASLCCNPTTLRLDVLACADMFASRGASMLAPRRVARGSRMAVGHMVCRCSRSRSWSRRVNVSLCCVAITGHRVIVRPLVRVTEVSKWVQRAIQAVIVVAAVRRRVVVVGVVAWCVSGAIVRI